MTRTTNYLMRPLVLLVWAVLVASVMVVFASQAQALTYTVANTDDAGEGSLRSAILDANASTGADPINFALSPSEAHTIKLSSQLPAVTDIAGLTTIDGGSADITISGNNAVRVFEVGKGAELILNNLTVADGSASATGFGGSGGGIFNAGTLDVTNSTLSGNGAADGGGGVFNASTGTLRVNNSTLSGNSATDANSTTDAGGAIVNLGSLTVNNSTLSDNSADKGGGIFNFSGTTTLHNTIVADSPTGGNCLGGITDRGYNIDEDGSCVDEIVTTSKTTDPLLGPLADNGGPTETHALLPGSAAIDIIPQGRGCENTTTDQRGVSRPQGDLCDIGAYEVEVEVDTTPPTLTETSPPQLKTDNVTAKFSEPVQNVTTETFILERKIAVKKMTPKFERVDATVSLDGISAVLDPVQDLPKGDYRATITTDVTDLADNELEDPVVWTFKVAKLP